MRFPDGRRSPALHHLSLVLAGLVGTFLLVGFVLRPSRTADVLDARTIEAISPFWQSEPWWWFVRLGNPASYLQFCLALVFVAALRRRWRLALLIPPTMVASELMAQNLKQLLAAPRDVPLAAARIADASWPSGHSTAAMTVALLAILVAPRRLRPLVAVVGGLGACGVGLGLIAGRYHYPTDVFGGYLCAAIWVTLAAMVLVAWQRWRPAPTPPDRRPLRPVHVAGPLLLLGLGLLIAASRAARTDGGLLGTVDQHTAAVVVVGAIVALALTLVAAATTLTAAGEDEAREAPLSGPRPAARAVPRRRWPPARG
ncbi:phosphatase PAP2 family protein [Patulibacter defluvii]|uniref:phosphatase PAP2 family protein n=1 Tax=Patulibacter defluvii TaxID=3095358 RepID=UPI002A76213D|nr:phosphatase PAP2 family protein [Patulibacter sp. DM4]